MKKIKTKFPINISNSDTWIFRRREFYNFPKLRVKSKKNVFLSHYGIMLKKLIPVRRTLPNAWYFKKPNAGFIFKFYRLAIETFLVCRFGKSLVYKTLNHQKNYLFIYSPWFGYFSWVTETLPRIIKTESQHEKLTLIVPENYSKKRFVKDSLKMFPKLGHEIIPEGVHMFIPRVTIPELKPLTYVFDPNEMQAYRNYVWKKIEDLNLNIETFDKIYVSRSKAKNRKIVNNDEVETIFVKNGFKVVNFEDYSFYEQVYLMKHCKILGGVHGAGFANIAYMPERSKLFELIKEYSSYHEERPSYWRLCSALNIDYYIQYCKPKEYGNYDLWVSIDLTIDIELLKTNIKLLQEINQK